MKTKFTLLSFLLLISLCVSAQTTRYVKPTATGTGDGSSWANASGNLQTMINASAANDKVWVARGTYKPHATDRNVSFTMKNGVAIYGGFVGTETLLSQRNWSTNQTILSGDLLGDDIITGSGASLLITNNTENSYHVVFNDNNGLNNTAILDGFTVSGGHANGTTSPNNIGGGIYNNSTSPSLSNLTFSANKASSGGGIYNNSTSSPSLSNVTFSMNYGLTGGGMFNSNSSPSLTNVTFLDNLAPAAGGGMFNSNSSPSLNNVTFLGNYGQNDGGGIYNNSSSPSLNNVIFSGNRSQNGGGMANYSSSPSLSNIIFSGNNARFGGGMKNNNFSSPNLNNVTFSGNSVADDGGGMHNNGSSPSLKNCLFWGNIKASSTATAGADITSLNSSTTTINYTLLQFASSNYTTGFTLGSGNLFAQNPLFVNETDPDGADNIFMTADDGLALTVCSPAANVGNNTGVASTDITGSPRIFNTTVDLGAYELQSTALTSPARLYVNATATGTNTGLTWANAFTSLQSALNYACSSNLTEIWVAKGTYKPHASDRNVSFTMKNGVAIYGGFTGTETLLTQRNWTTNPTILSGDLSGNDVVTGSDTTLSITNNAENSYHVIFNNNIGLNNTAILDGFTIRGGNANGSSSTTNAGGGIYNNGSSPSLRNITFTGNSASGGGGIYNVNSSPSLSNITFSLNSVSDGGGVYNDNSSPSFSNVTFSGNRASQQGGGMCNYNNSSPILSNVTFSRNSAAADGGAMYNIRSTISLSNVVFISNKASFYGGGMDNNASSLSLNNVAFSGNTAVFGGGMMNYLSSSTVLINITFSGNKATNNGGGIYNDSSSPNLKNCLFWGNTKAGSTTTVGADIGNFNNTSNSTISNTLMQLTSGNYTTGFTLGSGNLFAQNPLFFNAADPDGVDNIFMTADDGLALTVCSPAANVGNNTGVASTDITGSPRIFNTTVDLGAYELQTAAFTAATRLYVNATATGANTGLTWANAFTSLQSALNYACSSNLTEIWVAKGTYKPHATDRTVSFTMKNGVAIYGGFVGTETLLTQRNWTNNPTILSGDLSSNDVITGSGATLSITNNAENSFYVIFNNSNGLNNTAILDGFTISGGNSNSGSLPNYGGGMYNNNSSPNLRNITFSANSAAIGGGGMFNNSSSPTLSNITFSRNIANSYGGGMDNESSSSPSLTNIIFSGNKANFGGGIDNYFSSPSLSNVTFIGNNAGTGGGGIDNVSSSPSLNNVIFTGNSANNYGGGIRNQSSSPSLSNVTFSGNSATNQGGGMYNSASSPNLKNSIFWANTKAGSATSVGADIEIVNSGTTTLNYNLLQLASTNYTTGFTLGSGNLFAQNPLFVNAADPDGVDNSFMTIDDGLALTACSPLINMGNNTGVASTDITGSPRIFNTTVDLGAYEYQSTNQGSPVPNPTSNAPKCVGTTLTFNSAAGMSTYTWTGPNSFSASTQSPSISNVTALAQGTYTLTVTNANGCTATATTAVIIHPLSLTLQSPTNDFGSGVIIQKASNFINANNKVNSPANVTYQAGNTINLSPGFEAKIGAVFKAEISACTN